MIHEYLKHANYTVVLTGAGMSTESGVPDFRSSQGIWKDMNLYNTNEAEYMKAKKEKFKEIAKVNKKRKAK